MSVRDFRRYKREQQNRGSVGNPAESFSVLNDEEERRRRREETQRLYAQYAAEQAEREANAPKGYGSVVYTNQDYNALREGEKAQREMRAQMMPELEKKRKASNLSPEEELQYAMGSIEALPDNERDLMSAIRAGQDQMFEDAARYDVWGPQTGAKQLFDKYITKSNPNTGNGQKIISEAQNVLKYKYGWDDKKIEDYTLLSERLSNSKGTETYKNAMAISPDDSKGKKIGKSVYNAAYDLMYNPIKGSLGALSSLQKKPEGFGRDTNTWTNLPENISEEGTAQVVQNAIGNKHPIGQQAYQIGLSTLESGELALLGGGIGAGAGGVKGALAQGATLIPFATSAYNSGYKDARERGASDKDAQLYGIAAGAAEAGTEIVSLDHLWGMAKGTKVGRNLLIDWLAQAGIEASEEAASDLLNRYSDYLILGDDGTNAMTLAIDDYIDKGYSEEEAVKMAHSDFWKQVGMDALGGAISGGILGAGGIVAGAQNAHYNKVRDNAISNTFDNVEIKGDTKYEKELKGQAENYAKNPTQYLVDTMDDSTEEGKKRKAELQELADKEAEGKKLSASDRNFIEQSLWVAENEARNNKESMDARKAYEEYSKEMLSVPDEYRTSSKNITEDEARKSLSEAAAKGDIVSLGETYQDMKNAKSADLRSKAEEIYNSYAGMAESHGVAKEQIEGFKISEQEAYAEGLKGKTQAEIGAMSKKAAEAFRAGELARKENINANIVNNKNVLTKTRDGKEVTLAGVFTEDGKILTQDGENISISDIKSDETSANQKAYEYADTQPSLGSKNAYISNIKDGTNLEQYNIAWNNYFRAGRVGLDFKKETETGKGKLYADALGVDTVKAMYEAGANQTKFEKGKEATEGLNKALNIKKGSGVFEDTRTDKSDNINTEVLRMMANVSGLNIKLVDDTNVKDGINAYFDPKNSTVVVGSKSSAQAFHEVIGEFTEMYNSEGYEKMRVAAMQASKDIMGTEQFNHVMNAYKSAYGKAGQSNTDIKMSDEMTNDFAVAVMSTEKGREAFAKHLVENNSAKEAETIKDKLVNLCKKIVRSIKNLINHSNLMSYQKKLLRNGAVELEDNVDLFIKEWQKAVENYQNMDAKAAEEMKYSLSVQLTDDRIDDLIENYGASNPKYSQAYIAMINPRDFLKLTLRDEMLDKWNDTVGTEEHPDMFKLDTKQLKEETQTPFLRIDSEETEVEGHEGRHRMRALMEAGVESTPVVIEDFATKKSKEKETSMTFSSQDFGFGKVNNGAEATVYNLIPINNAYKDDIKASYGQDADIRYSLDVKNTVDKYLEKSSENVLNQSDKKFSMNVPVEEKKNLLVLHNVNEDEFLETLNLGGIPMPSFAVVKNTYLHTAFGDISIMFDKESIDPKVSRYNEIYGRDVWSPTFPRVEYELNNKVLENITNMYYKNEENIHREISDVPYKLSVYNAAEMLSENGGEKGLAKYLKDDYGMKELYLSEIGNPVEMVVDKGTESMPDKDVKKAKFLVDNYKDVLSSYEKAMDNGEDIFEWTRNNSDKLREIYKNQLKHTTKLTDSQCENLANNQKPFTLKKMIFDALKYEREGSTKSINIKNIDKTKEMIDSKINQKDFEKWIDSLVDGLAANKGVRNNLDEFTDYGNRRSFKALHAEITLENVMKIMKQNKNGERVSSLSNLPSISAKKYKNIKEMKADSDRLYDTVSTANDKEIKEKFAKLIKESEDIISEFVKSDAKDLQRGFFEADYLITDLVKECNTVEEAKQYLDKWTKIDNTEELAERIMNLVKEASNVPTNYFEAKPRRVVGFNEIRMVVLPEGTKQELKDKLNEIGIPYVEYDGTSTDRLNKINQEADNKELKFSVNVPEEETKDLIALHTLDEEKLIKALELGGFPMPSMAITRPEYINDRFGRISALFNKDSIDPMKNISNKIFGGDAWTPTFPNVDYLANTDVVESIRNRIKKYDSKAGEFGKGFYLSMLMDDDPSELLGYVGGEKGLFNRLKNDIYAMRMYLYEKGKEVEISKKVNKKEILTHSEILNAKYFLENEKELVDSYENNKEGVINWRENNTIKLRKAYRRYLRDTLFLTDEEIKNSLKETHISRITKLIHDAVTYKNTKGVITNETIDYEKTNGKIKNLIDANDYEKWLHEFTRGIEKESGVLKPSMRGIKFAKDEDMFKSTHYENTMDSIIRAMKENGELHPKDSIIKNAIKEYGSIEEVKNNSDRIKRVGMDEYSEFQKETFYLRKNIAQELEGSILETNPIVIGAIKYSKDYEGIKSYIEKNTDIKDASQVSKDIILLKEKIENMPSEYFEAKPERTVGLNEIVYVIIPKDSNEELKNLLSDKNIPFIEYDGTNEDRVKKVNDAADEARIKFSLNVEDDDFFDLFNGSNANETYSEGASILEEGMELLKNHTVDKDVVRKIANKIKQEYSSTIKLNDLANDLEKVFAYMQSEEYVNYNDMMRVLEEVAKPIVESSANVSPEEKEIYDSFINSLKGCDLRLTDVQKQEAANTFGSYGEYRRMVMPVKITNNGSSTLESVWDEVAEASGGILDADINEGDMPAALYDAVSTLRPTPKNNFGGDSDNVAKDLAMRIVEDYLSSQNDAEIKKVSEKMKQQNTKYRNELRTRYENKLKEVKKELREKYNDKKINNEEKIAELKAKNKEIATETRERHLASHEKQMIAKQANALEKWLAEPSEKNHIPRDMVEPVTEFLYALDFVEPEVKQNKNGGWYTRVYDHCIIDTDGSRQLVFRTLTGNTREEALAKFHEAINGGIGSQAQKKWTERMQLAKDLLNQVKNGDQFEHQSMDDFLQTIDPSLADEFNQMLQENRGVANINQLGYKDLNVINKTLRGITHAIRQGNKAFTQDATIEELANETMTYAKTVKEGKVHSKAYEKIKKTLRLDMANPSTFFTLNNADKVYKSLREGFNRKIADIRVAQDFMKKLMDGVSTKDWTGDKCKIYEFRVNGGTMRLTKAQIMSLYELSKRQQAMLHLSGGIKPSEIKQGRKLFKQDTPFHLSKFEIDEITKTLTEKEKGIADAMQRYMSTECAKQGNDAAMLMYGYEKFTDKDYFPISTDKTTITTNNSNLTNETMNSIERSGFTKQVKKNASNPILIKDIFDVFTDHVADMATYHGYAPAIKDANRWFNFRSVEKENKYQYWDTVKQAINRLSGDQGSNYFITLIKDINGSEKSQDIGNVFDFLIPNYKAAAVGANIRVIIQQPTAYVRAMNEIDPKYLFTVTPKQAVKAGKKMREQSEICWWKSQGYYETSIGHSMKQIITGQNSTLEKVKDVSMEGAGLADDLTWGVLYGAVTKEQKAMTKGLGITEEELDKRIKDRFDEVVDKTQVVDSTIHRSQYMRSKGLLTKMQTAFMAEPTKSYNMLMEAAVLDTRDGKGMKRTAKAALTFTLTSIVTAAAASLIDALRRDDDDKDWGELYKEAMLENIADNINPLNMIPVVKDFYNHFINTIKGDTFFNSSNRMDMDAITALMDAGNAIIKAFNGESNKTVYGNLLTIMRPLSQITGIPAYNLTRDSVSIYNEFFPDLKKSVGGSKYSNVYDALKAGRNEEEAVKKAIENGGTIKDIRSGITSRYKNDYYAMLQIDPDSAKDIAEQAKAGFLATGMKENEVDAIIKEWENESFSYADIEKAIESGEGIQEAMVIALQNKDPEKIEEHIVNTYSSTIKYINSNGIESDLEENANKALKEINPHMTFKASEKEVEAKEEERASAAALREKQSGYSDTIKNAVATGQGDWKNAINHLVNSGKEYSAIKSSITSDCKKKFIEDYNSGKDVSQQAARIASIKAYIDELAGTKIPKRYGGDYYSYEMDKLIDWIEPEEE